MIKSDEVRCLFIEVVVFDQDKTLKNLHDTLNQSSSSNEVVADSPDQEPRKRVFSLFDKQNKVEDTKKQQGEDPVGGDIPPAFPLFNKQQTRVSDERVVSPINATKRRRHLGSFF